MNYISTKWPELLKIKGFLCSLLTPIVKVFKGKKMAGHMGSRKTTVQSLVIVGVDSDKQLLLIKGGIPGATNSNVLITPAVKASP